MQSGKRRNQAMEEIEMTDPKDLSLNMAVKKRKWLLINKISWSK